jgi:hypothetical protein
MGIPAQGAVFKIFKAFTPPLEGARLVIPFVTGNRVVESFSRIRATTDPQQLLQQH